MTESTEPWDGVFWDIGGVIVELDSISAVHRSFIGSLVDELSIDVAPDDALEVWQQAVGNYFRERDGTEFRLAENAYHRGVESVVGRSVERSTWRPLFDQAFQEHLEPKPNALSTLDALAERDIHLGIISDIDQKEAESILRQFGLTSTFDSVTTSEEVGLTKPDPEIFETGLEKASAMLSRTLMVGDRYSHDIEGGRNIGMRTIAYGAEPGPAIDFRVDNLSTIIDILNGDHDPTATD